MKTVVTLASFCSLFLTSFLLFTPSVSGKYEQPQPQIQSPRLIRLAQEIATVGQEAANRFRHEVQQHGTPLIEPIPEDQKHLWVTFLWFAKEPVRNVVVFSGLTNNAYTRAVLPDIQMTRLAGTDIWFKTFKVRNDARFTYQFSVNDSLIPEEDEPDDNARRAKLRADPLNPHHAQDATSDTRIGPDAESLVEMPGAPPQLWLRKTSNPAGELKRYPTFAPRNSVAIRHSLDSSSRSCCRGCGSAIA
jgi:enterochelin esterase family protein